MCECGDACTCGHVGGVAGEAPAGDLVNISSCCCVCYSYVRSIRVSTVNADTLSVVACDEVLLASCTCCSLAIKPSFMDAQLLYYNPCVLFAPWYPIVPAVPAPERIRRSYTLVKSALNSGHVLLTSSNTFHSNIAVEYREVSWMAINALSTICSVVCAGFLTSVNTKHSSRRSKRSSMGSLGLYRDAHLVLC